MCGDCFGKLDVRVRGCPFGTESGRMVLCPEELCQLWVVDLKACSIKVLAVTLYAIGGTLRGGKENFDGAEKDKDKGAKSESGKGRG